MTISKNFRTMYDFLAREHPDILDWCKDQARWHRCPLGAILTWKEDAIMRLIEKKKIYATDMAIKALEQPEPYRAERRTDGN